MYCLIVFDFMFFLTSDLFMFYIVAKLSPPPESFESLADPEAKKEDKITKMAEAIMDEAVTRLVNEAVEAVLKEE
jgi:hypothetical protein